MESEREKRKDGERKKEVGENGERVRQMQERSLQSRRDKEAFAWRRGRGRQERPEKETKG